MQSGGSMDGKKRPRMNADKHGFSAGGNGANRELLSWGVGERLGSDLQERVCSSLSHSLVGVRQKASQWRSGKGRLLREIAQSFPCAAAQLGIGTPEATEEGRYRQFWGRLQLAKRGCGDCSGLASGVVQALDEAGNGFLAARAQALIDEEH